uniref:Photosystem I reaction center subunit VIII n=1 Tax=Dasyclonium flaccidum TaxID=2007274 RepID=A0A1Z1MKF7_9FLOR|nr:photosystem I reaction center subunit VIII [Dasyclonium flaccidum]ARW66567.1 photosystem I reaction center subunit VIII [Dasyclonium flaccidum]
MTASYLPSILVPIVGIIFPGITMALLFLYIEQDNIS